jgi:4-amino-4-deoxy-L-arabinose transferase-like glycosyltransferase
VNRAQTFFRAAWPVLLVAAGAVAVLLAFAAGYGLHRDEMYFIVAGRHPDFGYVDQPPITPLLNALSAAVFGVSSFGDRVLPSLSMGAVVLLSAAIAREFGGGRLAQFVAALTVAVSGCLAVYHLNSTEAYDVLGTTAFLYFVTRALRGADPRLWLAAGVAAGITLEDKNLILFVAAGLAAGVLIARRWELLRSRWLWGGVAIALAIWLPNLIWQASNGWPQLEMARSISSSSGSGNRNALLLLQVLFAGPLLFPIFLAGIWWLLRSTASVPWRPIGWAYLAVLVLLFATAGKGYYTGGMMPTLIAAGSVAAAGWLVRGRGWVRGLKGAGYALATAGSGLLVAALVLPIVPAASFPQSSAAKSDQELVSEFGWPSFVAQVRTVADSLAPADRVHAAIVTANYGEAGALELLSAPGLPPVYSGHNSYWSWGPPDESRTITILVGWDDASYWPQWLGPCTLKTKIDLGFPPDIGGEQGAGVWVCRGRTAPWTVVWSHFRSVG